MKRLTLTARTIGCRANQADSGAFLRALDLDRVRVVEDFADARIIVINTCCVTAQAERDCRKVARRARRENPHARVILTGCAVSGVEGFLSTVGEDFEAMGGGDVSMVELAREMNRIAQTPEGNNGEGDAGLPEGRTRALVKIQTGCEHGCAYCIVPKARGPQRSEDPAVVLEEIHRLREAGANEVVLTGVQIGAYGKDGSGFPPLSRILEMAADAMGEGRIRLSSVEPWSVDDDLISVMAAHPRICPHLHVPLQSGDDGVLGRMKRGYLGREWVARVGAALDRVEGLCLGTDVLCGFPGEDEAAFENTRAVLGEVRPAYVHAFPFSARPGTEAAGFTGGPSREEAKERVRRVLEPAGEWKRAFLAGNHGKTREIIVEKAGAKGGSGLTDNYVQVDIHEGPIPVGALVEAKIIFEPQKQRCLAEAIRLK